MLLCRCCEFGDKIFYNSRDIKCLLEDYFLLARPVHNCVSRVHGSRSGGATGGLSGL